MGLGGARTLRVDRREELAGPADFVLVDGVPHMGVDPLLHHASQTVHDLRGFMDAVYREDRAPRGSMCRVLENMISKTQLGE